MTFNSQMIVWRIDQVSSLCIQYERLTTNDYGRQSQMTKYIFKK